MSDIPPQLLLIRDRLEKNEIPLETVRALLSWFNASRRSWRNIEKIRATLTHLKIDTFPPFEGEYINSQIQFVRLDTTAITQSLDAREAINTDEQGGSLAASIPPAPAADATPSIRMVDPTHRIGRLASANTRPISITPDATLSEAVTIMLSNNFSQLPVMTSDREVKGMISWKSIGSRLALNQACLKVRDCLEEHHEIAANRSIFEAIKLIIDHDCVLIRDSNKKCIGIVSAADIGRQYDQLAGPFLLLGEIENQIRFFISSKLTPIDIKKGKDPANLSTRIINDVSDLTFGEYVYLLRQDEIWQKMELPIHRKIFLNQLDKIREIRNDVMHFDPDGISDEEIHILREFAHFLGRLRKLLQR